MLAGPERQGDAGPGPAAIVRSLQQAAVAREPAMRRVQEVDRVGGQVAVLRRAVGQRAPGLAAVLGPDDGRAGGPAVARVDELEIVEIALAETRAPAGTPALAAVVGHEDALARGHATGERVAELDAGEAVPLAATEHDPAREPPGAAPITGPADDAPVDRPAAPGDPAVERVGEPQAAEVGVGRDLDRLPWIGRSAGRAAHKEERAEHHHRPRRARDRVGPPDTARTMGPPVAWHPRQCVTRTGAAHPRRGSSRNRRSRTEAPAWGVPRCPARPVV